ncbi:side tail fiber assembly protein [Salmonella phage 41]|nr:side tail fiber assembly protein [Salmonella phage 41]
MLHKERPITFADFYKPTRHISRYDKRSENGSGQHDHP